MPKLADLERIIKVFYIEDVFDSDACPYCGTKAKKLEKHISDCEDAKKNMEKAHQTGWAMHGLCGKVLVLNCLDGLCLIENSNGRYVVPIIDLEFGHLSKLLENIEESELAEEEIEELINLLRIKQMDYTKSPKLPKLWPGNRIEVQMGKWVKSATIKSRLGNGYLASVDDNGPTLKVYPKDILRII